MKIFFIGVCGTATGNVAILMKKLGHDVLGSDRGMYEPMKSALANAGVAAYENWDAKKLEAFAPDLVVVGNATRSGSSSSPTRNTPIRASPRPSANVLSAFVRAS